MKKGPHEQSEDRDGQIKRHIFKLDQEFPVHFGEQMDEISFLDSQDSDGDKKTEDAEIER